MDRASGGAAVDEVEAVRNLSAGSLQGAFTTLRRESTKPAGNGRAKRLSVMELMKKDTFHHGMPCSRRGETDREVRNVSGCRRI